MHSAYITVLSYTIADVFIHFTKYDLDFIEVDLINLFACSSQALRHLILKIKHLCRY